MFLFVSAILMFVAAVAAVPLRRQCQARSLAAEADGWTTSASNNHLAAMWLLAAAIAFGVGSVLTIFAASAQVVSTKNVGIVTEFGRPTATLSNGLHLTAPWAHVTEMDAAVQTDSYTNQSRDPNCITVRIAHQTTACVNVSIRWRINESAGRQLFQSYRTFDNVRDSLVTRELSATMNAVFESYDPLAIDANGISTAPSLASLSGQVATQMQADIGKEVTLLNPGVIIQVINFQQSTQDRINALQQQIAQTRIAAQQLQTNTNLAKANQALSASVSHDPNVLVAQCLTYLNEALNKGLMPPAGFSCWPGSSSSVVVPASR